MGLVINAVSFIVYIPFIMQHDSFDHVRLKISEYSIVISGHVVENLFSVFEELVMVKRVRISLEMRTTELVGLVLLKPTAGSGLVLECEPVPFIRRICFRYRKPAGKMSCYSVSFGLAEDRSGRNRLAALCVISLPELTVFE